MLGRLLFITAIIMFLCGIGLAGIVYGEWLIALLLVLSSIVIGILGIFIYIYANFILPIREAAKNMDNMFQSLSDSSNMQDIFGTGGLLGLKDLLGDIEEAVDSDEYSNTADDVVIVCTNCGETVSAKEEYCPNCKSEI